jgi:hypothetical protein
MIHHSLDLIEECMVVERNDGQIEAPGRKKDDRVIAAALAIMPWVSTMRVKLWQMGETRAKASERRAKFVEQNRVETPTEQVADRVVRDYLQRIGVR